MEIWKPSNGTEKRKSSMGGSACQQPWVTSHPKSRESCRGIWIPEVPRWHSKTFQMVSKRFQRSQLVVGSRFLRTWLSAKHLAGTKEAMHLVTSDGSLHYLQQMTLPQETGASMQ